MKLEKKNFKKNIITIITIAFTISLKFLSEHKDLRISHTARFTRLLAK